MRRCDALLAGEKFWTHGERFCCLTCDGERFCRMVVNLACEHKQVVLRHTRHGCSGFDEFVKVREQGLSCRRKRTNPRTA